MQVTRSFLVRIYRQEPEALTGLVDAVDTGERFDFRSLAELCDTLTRRATLSNSRHLTVF